MQVTVKEILNLYDKEIRVNVRNKRKVLRFDRFKMANIESICKELNSLKLKEPKYNIFVISEPKHRVIMSLSIKDKIINHYLTRSILIPKLDKRLDIRNVATRTGMGMDYGIRLVKKYFERLQDKTIYVLKLDISKYFYTIDHEVLKKEIKDYLTLEEYDLISQVIDSSNNGYINREIDKWIKKLHVDLPKYQYGKGLPIGNMTSQFLSIYYLNRLDHYIVHDLHLPCYVRYMDDFIILDNDLEHLKECMNKIIYMLENTYKLKVNRKKTCITKASEGVVFLGYLFKTKGKRLIIRMRGETWMKLKKNVIRRCNEYKKGLIDFQEFYSVMNNYLHTFKFCNQKKINDYVYEKIRTMRVI